MRIIRVNYPRDHEIVLAGDLHAGSLLSDEKGFLKCIDYILKKPDRRVVWMGDMHEGRMLDHPYFDLADHKLLPEQVHEYLVEILGPVRYRTDVMIMGNHEWDLRKFGNMTNRLCKALSTPEHKIEYGTMSCILEVYTDEGEPQLMYKIYLHHGFGTIRSQAKDFEQLEGNKKARLKLMLRNLAGDCLVMAIGHCLSEDTEILTEDGWTLWNDVQEGKNVLTFNTESGLAEWQYINQKHVHFDEYNEMIHYHNLRTDFCVTPEHRIIWRQHDNQRWRESSALQTCDLSQITIPVAAPSGRKDYNISDEWIRLLGWLISEGHFRKNGAVQLFQNWSKRHLITDV